MNKTTSQELKENMEEALLYKMKDTDLVKVLNTAQEKVAESVKKAEAVHLSRLSKIRVSHG